MFSAGEQELKVVMLLYFAAGVFCGNLVFVREAKANPRVTAVMVGLGVFHVFGYWRASRTGRFLGFSKLGWWGAPVIGFLIGFVGVWLTS